jgi:hypothetical protein
LTLRYRSTWFLAGAAISLLSWMAVLVGLVVNPPAGARTKAAQGD